MDCVYFVLQGVQTQMCGAELASSLGQLIAYSIGAIVGLMIGFWAVWQFIKIVASTLVSLVFYAFPSLERWCMHNDCPVCDHEDGMHDIGYESQVDTITK